MYRWVTIPIWTELLQQAERLLCKYKMIWKLSIEAEEVNKKERALKFDLLPHCSRFIPAVQISFKDYCIFRLQVMLSFYRSLLKLSSNDRILENKPNADKKVWVLPKDFSNHAKQNALINDTNSGTAPVSVRATGNVSIQFSGCWIRLICNLGAC